MFIVMEGVDRVGKSTTVDNVANLLRQSGLNVIVIHESQDPMVQYIKQSQLDIVIIVKMFHRMRQEHQELIYHFKDSKDILLWDRYYDSTYVYGHKALSKYSDLYRNNFKYIHPDLTFYLYADISVILDRIQDETDRFTSSKSIDKIELNLKMYDFLYKNLNIFPDISHREIFSINTSNSDESIVAKLCFDKILDHMNK